MGIYLNRQFDIYEKINQEDIQILDETMESLSGHADCGYGKVVLDYTYCPLNIDLNQTAECILIKRCKGYELPCKLVNGIIYAFDGESFAEQIDSLPTNNEYKVIKVIDN